MQASASSNTLTVHARNLKKQTMRLLFLAAVPLPHREVHHHRMPAEAGLVSELHESWAKCARQEVACDLFANVFYV